MDIKIVVCCLEFRFFKRSVKQLERLYEMLHQQLLFADKIHFLTEPDKEDFEKTMDQLVHNRQLQAEEQVDLSDLKDLKERYQSWCFDFKEAETVVQKRKSVFVSGIYTIDPLVEEEIFYWASKLDISGENMFEILSNREPNILHFGMIRGEKGVDEAIDLGLYLEEKGLENKVIIAGKLMLDLGMVSNIFRKVFDILPKDFYIELGEALKSQEIKEALSAKKRRDFSEVEKLITNEKKHEKFNNFF